MSLKAKIEAVIYASEEPVTLAQLVGLLGQEAQAELDRAESAQASLALNDTEAELNPELNHDLNQERPDILNETEEDLEAAAALDPTLSGELPPTDAGELPGTDDGELSSAEGPVFEATAEATEVEATQHSPEVVEAERGVEAADPGLPGTADLESNVEPAVTESRQDEGQGEVLQAEGLASSSGEEASAEASPGETLADAAAVAKAERARMARLRAYFRTVMDSLIADYSTGDRGLEIREVAGGFRFATKPEYHDAVRGFVRSLKPPLKLSLQALETLAVIAYKQPITAPEISEIRGVDSGGVLGSLMARKLISTAGRKQVIGRPILYKTTKEFLLKFGLKDTNELPSIEEFERMAGQMAEQEEIPMPDTADPRPDVDPALEQSAEKAEPERDVHAPQADGDSAPADNLEGAPEDKASIDGRVPSLPPNYDAAELADNPSAQEAEIQSEQGS